MTTVDRDHPFFSRLVTDRLTLKECGIKQVIKNAKRDLARAKRHVPKTEPFKARRLEEIQNYRDLIKTYETVSPLILLGAA